MSGPVFILVLCLSLLLALGATATPKTYTLKVWDESAAENADVRYKPYLPGKTSMTAYWSFGSISIGSVTSCLAGIGHTPTNASVVALTSIGVKTTHTFSNVDVPPRKNMYFIVKCLLIDSSTAQGASSGVTFDDTPPLPGSVEIVDSSDPSIDAPEVMYQQYNDEVSAVWTDFVENDTSHPVVPTFDCIVKTSTNGQCRSYFGYNNFESSYLQAEAGSDINLFTDGEQSSYDGQPSLFAPGVHKYVFSVVHACSEVLTWKLDELSVSSEWKNVETCPSGCDGVRLSNAVKDACGVCNGNNGTCTRIEPFISCIRMNPDKTCSVSFGYHNRGRYNVRIPAGSSDNRFVGALTGGGDQGQTTIFYKGRYHNVVQVLYDCSSKKNSLEWQLNGRKIAATPNFNYKKYTCKGCDGVKGSTKQRDRCGVCGGDGTSCTEPPQRYSNDSFLNIGIAKYEVALGSSATDISNLVVPFTDVALTNRYTFSDLNLQDKRYYVHVKAYNLAGLVTLITSDPVQVDTTPPIAATIYDGTELRTDATYQSSLTEIAANWPDVIDPDSGIYAYTFGVGTAPGEYDVMPEISVGTVTTYTARGLSLQVGTTYYVNIVAINGAQLETEELSSNGITVTINPPEAGTVYDGLDFQKDIAYQSSQTTISAHWVGFRDTRVGIREYRCGVGTTSTNANITGLISVGLNTSYTFHLPAGTLLQNGIKYYFIVQAINNILRSTTVASDGVVIDSTPPIAGVLKDGNGDSDFSVQTSTTTFTGQWSAFSDPETGIKEYRCGLSLDSSGNADVAAFRTVSADMRACTFTNLQMVLGKTYYFVVEGVNSVNMTTRAVSNGVSIIASRGSCNDKGECNCDNGWSGPFCSIGIPNVSPVLECVLDNCNNTKTAYFGYNNLNPDVITIPVGTSNKVTPVPFDQGQPILFKIGRNYYQFNLTTSATTVTWHVGNTPATASPNANACPWQAACKTVPTAPKDLAVVTFNAASVSLKWSAPSSNGGADITNYRLTYSCTGCPSTTLLVGGTGTTYTVTGLTFATAYTFTVAAKNAVGYSAESAPPLSVTTSPVVPSAPTSLATPVITSTTIGLTWVAPSSNGGASITNYRITYTPAGGVAATAYVGSSSTSFTLSGLVPGKQYTITVSAQNSAGWSLESTSVVPVTLTVPGYPRNLRASNMTTSTVTLTWEAPTTTGGTAITNYRITVVALADNTKSTILVDGATAMYTVTGLNPGEAYNMTVAAKNNVGFSEESTAVVVTVQPVIPSAPQSLTASSITATSFTLTWSPPAYSGGAAITNYRISYTTPNGVKITVTVPSQMTSTSLSQLQPGTQYVVTVAAKNTAGWSIESAQVTPTTLATFPAAPTDLQSAAVTSSSISLSWKAPTRDGGAAITEYQITYVSSSSSQTLNTGSSSTSFLLTGLHYATYYTLTVAAVNAIGASCQSEPIWVSTLATVPSAPQSVAVSSVTSTEASLSWDAPASNGGSTIERYRITYSATGGDTQTVIVGASSYVITNLQLGTEYSVTIAAENSVGFSPESVAVTFTTQNVPSAPNALSADSITSSTISLSWSTPTSDGSATIMDYRVTFTITGGSAKTSFVGSATTSIVLHSLKPGAQYTISVAAKNSVGFSVESGALVVTTLAVVPGAPTNLTISGVTSNSLQLTWSAPQSDGGSAISDYRVTYTPSGDSSISVFVGSAALTYTLTGLEPGIEYAISVAAQNSIGMSDESSVATLVTSATTPGQVLALTATIVTSTTIKLDWSAPLSNGGATLSDYRITFGLSGGESHTLFVGQAATTYTLIKLLSGAQYEMTVAAMNPLGLGPESDTVVATTNIGAPSAPTALTLVSAQETAVSMSWSTPDWNGGDVISEYRVTYTAADGSPASMLTGSTELEFTLTNLLPGTQYIITVAAKNSAGFSEESGPISCTTLVAVPSAPYDLGASSITKNSIQLDWKTPSANGGAPLSHYRISCSSFTVFVPASTTSYTIVNLSSGTTYAITVAANNSAGWSAESNPVFPITLSVPSNPVGLSASSVTSSSMTISWTAPASDGGAAITGYVVYYHVGDQSSTAVALSNETSAILTNLYPATTYSILVVAKNSVGLSAPSSNLSVTTLAVAPNAPESLTATAVSASGVDLSWVAPSYDGGAPISDYRITIEAADNSSTSVLVGSSITTFSLAGLAQGSVYSFMVAACNDVGCGSESTAASVTTWDVPSAPQSVSILFVDSRSLVIGWTAPNLLGGVDAISDYRVTWTNNATGEVLTNSTGSGSVTEMELSGLIPNMVYKITISAANSVGFGTESDAIFPITNIELPSAPRNVRISKIRSTSMAVSWLEPVWNGGADITDYSVILVANVAGNLGMFIIYSGNGTSTSIVLEHLAPDTEYFIVVAAKNVLGFGDSSEDAVVVRTLPEGASPDPADDDVSYIAHGHCFYSNNTCVCSTGYHGADCDQIYSDIAPILISVVPNGDGTSVAWFGYENTASFVQNIPAGTSNFFSTPIISTTGPLLTFEQGTFTSAGQEGTFSVLFDEDQGVPVWNLGSANTSVSLVENRGFILPNGTLVCLSKWFGADCSVGMNNVVPSLVSVINNGDGTSNAIFNIISSNLEDIDIPIGPFNRFEPEPANRGQPTVFIGNHTTVVSITFNDSDALPIWHLGSNTGGSRISNGYCLDDGTCSCLGSLTCQIAVEQVSPVLIKIEPVLGTDILRAYFGYHNRYAHNVTIPVGDRNRVLPAAPTGDENNRQPTVFRPGLVVEGSDRFYVDFSGQTFPSWVLGNTTLEITPTSSSDPDQEAHGYCIGSECTCFETWSGPDCTLGVINVEPILTNVTRVGSSSKSRAYFGYISNNTATITIPVGKYNYFTPGPSDRGQVIEFTPGRADDVFIVEFDTVLGVPVWYIGIHSSNESQHGSPIGDPDLGGDTTIPPDTTPPIPGIVFNGPVKGVDVRFSTSMDSLFATWSGFVDPESGINRYLCAAGTSPFATDVVDFVNVGRNTKCSFYGLSLKQSVHYYILVQAINGAMLATNVSSNALVIENTPPIPGTIFNGPTPGVQTDVQYSNTTLDVNWAGFSDPESGILSYRCGVSSLLGFNDEVVPLTSVKQGQTSCHFSKLTLNSGSTYFFVIEAKNGAGMVTVAYSGPLSVLLTESENVTDTTPPIAGVVYDGTSLLADLEFQTENASSLSGTWFGFRDPNSGISKYHVGIGTSPSAANVVPLVNVGRVNTYTFSNLALTNGAKYYFIVQAFNAYNLSTIVASNGVVVDMTPPVKGTVFNGLEAGKDPSFQVSASVISARWSGFRDPESGIRGYRIAVGTSSGKADFISWTDIGNVTQYTISPLSLTQSVTYYFMVEATNMAGLKTMVGGNGITVDYTPPVFSFITVDTSNAEPAIEYSNSTTNFGGFWSAYDPETGISEFLCGIGTKSTVADLVPLQKVGLNRKCEFASAPGFNELLRSGFVYYLVVEAVNGAGVNTLRASKPVLIDNSPPKGTVNHGLQPLPNGEDIKNQVLETTFSARWNISDDESGIYTFQFGIGTSRFSDDVLQFHDVGLMSFYTATDLALKRNTVYYVTIKARNKALGSSVISPSTGVRIGTVGIMTSTTEKTEMAVLDQSLDMKVEVPPGLLPFPVEIVALPLKPDDFVSNPNLERPSREFVSTALSNQIPASSNLIFTLDAFGVPEGQENNLTFLEPLTIKLSYLPGDLDEKVDPANLALMYWDTEGKSWRFAKDSCPEPYEADFPDQRLHVVNICHFTQFAVFGKNVWAPYLLFGGIASAIGIFMFVMLSSVFLLTPFFLVFALYRKLLRYLNHRRISPQSKGETFAVVPKPDPAARRMSVSSTRGGRGGRGGSAHNPGRRQSAAAAAPAANRRASVSSANSTRRQSASSHNGW